MSEQTPETGQPGTPQGGQGAETGTPEDGQAQPSWAELFPDMEPAQVREALEQSRKWERRAKDSHAKAQQYDQLQEAQLTEAQRLTQRAETAERERAQAATELARYRVAAAQGVPAELVDLLTGEDEDAMTSTAKRLMTHLKASAPATPSYDGGARTSAPQPAGMSDLIRQAAGRS